ncbi:MAG: hypothetical protein ACLTW7_14800 [Enterococcus sp.]
MIVRPKIEIEQVRKTKIQILMKLNAVDENSQPKEEITIIDTVSTKI